MGSTSSPVRAAAFAGRWYPGSARELGRVVDEYLSDHPVATEPPQALVSPHAGLMYSGPVAGYGYAAVKGHTYSVAILIGPSHYVPFRGAAVVTRGVFDTPLGPLPIHEALASRLMDAANGGVQDDPVVHAREHSLELQLPFLKRVLPDVPIVPVLMGSQSRATVERLAGALTMVLSTERPLVVASSDLSHYQPRPLAARLDGLVLQALERFDPDALQDVLEARPEHACGGGPIVTAMRVARALGATAGRVLHYGDSGDVSGDTQEVVGYVSAAFDRP